MTIAKTIDAINDKLAGSDQPAATTIEGALKLLLDNVGSGGGGGDSNVVVIETEWNADGNCYKPLEYTYSDIANLISEQKVIILKRTNRYYYYSDLMIEEDGDFNLDYKTPHVYCFANNWLKSNVSDADDLHVYPAVIRWFENDTLDEIDFG